MKEIVERALENLKPGQKYTLVLAGCFGCSATVLNLISIEGTKYAQYENALKIIFKQPRKRKNEGTYLHEKTEFAIYDGEVKVEQDAFFEIEDQGILTVKRSKYASFDPRYFDETIQSIKAEPIVINRWKNRDVETSPFTREGRGNVELVG